VPEPSRRARQRSFLGPLLLIAFGLFLLLDNLGALPGGSWEVLWRLWPVFLVLLGADMILRGLGPGRAAQALRLSVLAVLVGAFFLLAAFHERLPGARDLGNGYAWKERSLRVPLRGAREAEVRIDWDHHPGRLEALHGSRYLLEAQLAYRGELDYEVSRSEERVEVLLDSRTRIVGFRPFAWVLDEEAGRWRVALVAGTPLRLDLESGSGGLRADLSELQVTELTLDSGSGSVDLTLPRRGDLTGTLDTGSGTVTLRRPEGLALRLERKTRSGSFEPGDGLVRAGRAGEGEREIWETEGFAESAERATLQLDQGTGRVRLR
jgi:hypothetical protein